MKPTRAEVLEWLQARMGRTLTPVEQADVLRSTGCEGDDAFELITGFANRFEVDMTAYLWNRHHCSEGRLLRPDWPLAGVPRTLVPLSVTLLHRAAVARRWPVEYPDLPRVRDLSWANVPLIMAGLVGTTLLVLWAIPRLF